MRPRFALALAAALAAAPGARAESRTGHRTVEVRLGPMPGVIESWLPRDGAYGRALQAVRAAEYRRAEELFLEAGAEARRAEAAGQIRPARARLIAAHSEEWEALQVALLRKVQREVEQLTEFQRRRVEAGALHNLFLTSTAWLGRPDAVLYERAANSYRSALRAATATDIRDDRAAELVLEWSALLARGGHRKAALNEAARVSVADRWSDGHIVETAELYAALGDTERALAALLRARDLSPDWDRLRANLRIANDFDILREDPRFVRLVGGED